MLILFSRYSERVESAQSVTQAASPLGSGIPCQLQDCYIILNVWQQLAEGIKLALAEDIKSGQFPFSTCSQDSAHLAVNLLLVEYDSGGLLNTRKCKLAVLEEVGDVVLIFGIGDLLKKDLPQVH